MIFSLWPQKGVWCKLRFAVQIEDYTLHSQSRLGFPLCNNLNGGYFLFDFPYLSLLSVRFRGSYNSHHKEDWCIDRSIAYVTRFATREFRDSSRDAFGAWFFEGDGKGRRTARLRGVWQYVSYRPQAKLSVIEDFSCSKNPRSLVHYMYRCPDAGPSSQDAV